MFISPAGVGANNIRTGNRNRHKQTGEVLSRPMKRTYRSVINRPPFLFLLNCFCSFLCRQINSSRLMDSIERVNINPGQMIDYALPLKGICHYHPSHHYHQQPWTMSSSFKRQRAAVLMEIMEVDVRVSWENGKR